MGLLLCAGCIGLRFSPATCALTWPLHLSTTRLIVTKDVQTRFPPWCMVDLHRCLLFSSVSEVVLRGWGFNFVLNLITELVILIVVLRLSLVVLASVSSVVLLRRSILVELVVLVIFLLSVRRLLTLIALIIV